MSIVINGLTKNFGKQKAVDNISFTAEKGKIMGFLGPNGAGKSTTMKILTGYIPPSSGNAMINGMDVVADSLNIRKILGYLPEQNPLYLEMYVKEYLGFIGSLYRLKGKNLKFRIKDVIDRCGISSEQNKKIGALSKGYRQRVGLAQAFIHNPDVLILDEPTTGLDPNQLLEIRTLIKKISKNKTVIISTHIMQEVQFLCDHVVIINKGKIVADKPLKDLMQQSGDARSIAFTFSTPVEKSLFEKISTVKGIATSEESKNLTFHYDKSNNPKPEILKVIADNNLPLDHFKEVSQSLEDVFHKLTQN
ncbi:MAG TPA: gliding motility-associated ABC transporter ATP-binding subunit GldA [Cyclobacteriaceae bacterium]